MGKLLSVGFIGSGQVATQLALALAKMPVCLVREVYSRNFYNAHKLAVQINARAVACFSEISSDIDMWIVAVKDDVIEEVITSVLPYLGNSLVVHTSGSVPMQVLERYHQRVGVFYPLQTFNLGREIDWMSTPILLESSQKNDLSILQTLARKISANVYCYTSEQRLALHLAAVVACNFSNLCYDIAYKITERHRLDYKLLAPLILETAEKAIQNIPSCVQTGPAKRGDKQILEKHQQILNGTLGADYSELYKKMSHLIMAQSLDK